MLFTDPTRPAQPAYADLLPVIQRSRILAPGKFEDVRTKVATGELPREPYALAEQLIKAGVITEFQASRLLRNKINGLVIGRYVILDRIGSGAMGRVYKARHLLMDRIVALKIIAPEYVASARKIARFQREIRLIGRLDHPNVVRAFDADQVSQIPYIAMEYVSGQTLGQKLRDRGALPPDDVVNYAAQASLGLAHAHEQGIVHRDIKPSNLLLSNDKQLKILDFGLGILMENDGKDNFATNDGIAVGTIDYMSPEQTCGHELDGRSDLYSLGCSMYHLITRQLLFPGSSTIERLTKRVKGQAVSISEMHPELPVDLVLVMEKLLAPRPEDRYQTAREAAAALFALTPQNGHAAELRGFDFDNSRPSTSGAVEAPVSGSESQKVSYTESVSTPGHEATAIEPSSSSAPSSATAASTSVNNPPRAAAPLPPLFRFLIFLAEQPVGRIVAGTAVVLSIAFGAGFAAAMCLK